MRRLSSSTRLALSATALSLIALAGAAGSQLWLTDGWRPHDPAPPSLRAFSGVLWAMVQMSVLAGAYASSARLFGGLLAGGGVIGLAVMSAGAYGFVMASNYNARPRAAEVLVDGSRYTIVRRRESYEDLVAGEIVL